MYQFLESLSIIACALTYIHNLLIIFSTPAKMTPHHKITTEHDFLVDLIRRKIVFLAPEKKELIIGINKRKKCVFELFLAAQAVRKIF